MLAADILGISRSTAQRWLITPPKEWWWISNLIYIMDLLIEDINNGSSRKLKVLAASARLEMQEYRPLRKGEQFHLEADPTELTEVRRHILSLFAEHDQLSSRMLKKPKYTNNGLYKQGQIRRALTSLELDSWTEGFGENKVTYYMLPREA